jgi:hypothetical protein
VLRAKACLKNCNLEGGVLDFGPLPDEE